MKTREWQKKEPVNDCFRTYNCPGIHLSFRLTEPMSTSNPLIPVLTLATLIDDSGKSIAEHLPEFDGKSIESANVPWYKMSFPDGQKPAMLVFETVFIVKQSQPNPYQIEEYLNTCKTVWLVRAFRGKGTAFSNSDDVFLAAGKTEIRMRKVVALE